MELLVLVTVLARSFGYMDTQMSNNQHRYGGSCIAVFNVAAASVDDTQILEDTFTEIRSLSDHVAYLSAKLQGKVAFITGAASGLGEASARLFVANGAKVVIADIQDEKGTKVATELGYENARFVHLQCDQRQ
ncbi:unnamed protein product [Sphagnum troendelagicum]|uniref:Short-chain dehydrogenase n=1 Tax=Sphagnum troendelagicum TaxID=128251 RepID=A0ABP0U5M6_9BRYO